MAQPVYSTLFGESFDISSGIDFGGPDIFHVWVVRTVLFTCNPTHPTQHLSGAYLMDSNAVLLCETPRFGRAIAGRTYQFDLHSVVVNPDELTANSDGELGWSFHCSGYNLTAP